MKTKKKETVELKKSLAGTGKDYAVGELTVEVGGKKLKLGEVQVRMRSSGDGAYAHIQIHSGSVNIDSRGYGVVIEQEGLKRKSHFSLACPKAARGF